MLHLIWLLVSEHCCVFMWSWVNAHAYACDVVELLAATRQARCQHVDGCSWHAVALVALSHMGDWCFGKESLRRNLPELIPRQWLIVWQLPCH